MKTKLLFIVLIVLGLNSSGQVLFEKGYYINNSNKKINCLIKNYDWGNNPESFEIKLSEDSKISIKSINQVKEFSLSNGQGSYIRKTVKIDVSSNKIDRLSDSRSPLFEEKQVFLKILILGKASLYSYQNSNTKLFFYSINNIEIKPLVYKTYLNKDEKIATNSDYKQQLINDLTSDSTTKNVISNVDYDKKELTNLFLKYNTSRNEDFSLLEKKSKGDFFNLSLQAGLNFASSFVHPNSMKRYGDLDFNDTNVKFAIESEFIILSTQNRLACFLKVLYQSSEFETSKEIRAADFINGQVVIDEGLRTYRINYSSLEIPIGARYYFSFKGNSKFFFNAAIVLNKTVNSSIEIQPDEATISTSTNFGIGLGYKFRDKFSLELNYQTPRDLINENAVFDSKYNSLTLMFGYSIF